ncbi:MAG: hypothetical protein ABJA70_13580, partial [Chryseolinea sp.]
HRSTLTNFVVVFDLKRWIFLMNFMQHFANAFIAFFAQSGYGGSDARFWICNSIDGYGMTFRMQRLVGISLLEHQCPLQYHRQ